MRNCAELLASTTGEPTMVTPTPPAIVSLNFVWFTTVTTRELFTAPAQAAWIRAAVSVVSAKAAATVVRLMMPPLIAAARTVPAPLVASVVIAGTPMLCASASAKALLSLYAASKSAPTATWVFVSTGTEFSS